MQALAEANHLSPPYRILERVSALIIPGGGVGFAGPPEVAAAMAPRGAGDDGSLPPRGDGAPPAAAGPALASRTARRRDTAAATGRIRAPDRPAPSASGATPPAAPVRP